MKLAYTIFYEFARYSLMTAGVLSLVWLPYELSIVIFYFSIAASFSHMLGDYNWLLLVPLGLALYFLPVGLAASIATLSLSTLFALSSENNRNYLLSLLSLEHNDIEPISDILWFILKVAIGLSTLAIAGIPLTSLGFSLDFSSTFTTIKDLTVMFFELVSSYLTPFLSGLSLYEITQDNPWILHLALLIPSIALYLLVPSYGIFDICSHIIWALLLWRQEAVDLASPTNGYTATNLHVAAANNFWTNRMISAISLSAATVPSAGLVLNIFKSINLLWDVTYAAVKVHEKETGQPILAFE